MNDVRGRIYRIDYSGRSGIQWSNGSYAGIRKTITTGVSEPKECRSAMPPMGGAQRTSKQVSAVAAYVWGLRRHTASDGQH
jgi:hypothetical protein